jgi:hypothetical protein
MNATRLRVLLPLGLCVGEALAQCTWSPVPVATPPPPRSYGAMAHDYVRDRIVLWGGQGLSGPSTDTWELDGGTWTQRQPPQSPPAARGSMCFDRGRLCMVLVVRTFPTGVVSTWEYDGTTWTQRALATQPVAPFGGPLVYDSSRGVVVLFSEGFHAATASTWEYSGIDWVQRSPATSPPPRYGSSLAFDPHRGRAILHGGYTQTVLSDTWEYDGTNWLPASGSAGPARAGYGFAFDAYRRRAVLFGDLAVSAANTLEYEAGTWSASVSAGPPTLEGPALVYDVLRQECVMFGGIHVGPNAPTNATYRYRPVTPAATVPFGQGCAGGSVVPGFLQQPFHAPYLGLTFGVRMYSAPGNQPSFVAAGLSRTSWNGVPLPLPLGFVGMTGCQLLVSGDVLLPTTVSGANATTELAIPPQLALLGAQFFLQGFVFEPGANPMHLINTRGLECTIGSR